MLVCSHSYCTHNNIFFQTMYFVIELPLIIAEMLLFTIKIPLKLLQLLVIYMIKALREQKFNVTPVYFIRNMSRK